MKLEFPPYETVVPTPIGTTVYPLRNYKGSPIGFLLTTIEQVGSVVRDSCGTEPSRLCLSLIHISPNPKALAVLHYDTEQSEAQLYKNLGKTLRRADVETVPDFYHSLYLASLSRKDRLKLIRESMDLFRHKHGGIHLVVIDGIADLSLIHIS